MMETSSGRNRLSEPPIRHKPNHCKATTFATRSQNIMKAPFTTSISSTTSKYMGIPGASLSFFSVVLKSLS